MKSKKKKKTRKLSHAFIYPITTILIFIVIISCFHQNKINKKVYFEPLSDLRVFAKAKLSFV